MMLYTKLCNGNGDEKCKCLSTENTIFGSVVKEEMNYVTLGR